MQANSFKGRAQKFLQRGILAVICVFLLLLIPEPRFSGPKGAGGQAFLWNQDVFWTGLEQQFLQQRGRGCDALAGLIDSGVADLNRTLDSFSGKELAPEHPDFVHLETNLFRLAPMIAACPQRLQDYLGLITRARAEVKKQSERWDMNSLPARQRIYRVLFGGRVALEEVMLQSPVDFPQLAAGIDEPSRTPAAQLLGVTVHSGDVLVSRGGAPTSALIARGNDYPGNFSHIALLHVDDKSGRVSLIESHIERGVAVSSAEEYLHDKKLRVMVLRLRADLPALVADPMAPHKAATAALDEALRHHIPYDFAMDYHDHSAQFCSEVASAAYERVGIRLWMGLSTISSPTVTAWLGSLGVRHFETQEPSDLEYDPQLRVVAEWRERSTLLKAHADDAVTDMLLESAAPGEPLDYKWWLLPMSRAGKGYSLLLNAFGKIGPVPEGMSATTALRVKKYLEDHERIAARVLILADAFKSKNGYTPPYWELLKMAKEAAAVPEQRR